MTKGVAVTDEVPPCTLIGSPTGQGGQPPHASWDLDVGDGTSWLRALQICQGCPFIGWCTQEREDHRRLQRRNPQDVIWAGVAYSTAGEPMSVADLRLRATLHARRETRRRGHIAGGRRAAG